MKGIFNKVAFSFICFVLLLSFAKAEDGNIILENTKYYKTVTYLVNSSNINNLPVTYEITEEEYNNANVNEPKASSTIETTYKKMTTSITQNGSYYRYKNVLLWKIAPSTRSYDIIGIGFYNSVKVKGSTHFEQYYCYTGGSCYTTTTNYPQIFSTGAGTSFLLPSGNLSSLKQTFYFDVEKNTTATIIRQLAAGDYSHATSSISQTNSKKYSVNSNGISLNGSIVSYYDNINTATAIWEGTW